MNLSEKEHGEFKKYADDRGIPISSAIKQLAHSQLRYLQGRLSWQRQGIEWKSRREEKSPLEGGDAKRRFPSFSLESDG